MKKKIQSGDVIGLDDVGVATHIAFDQLIRDLKKFTLADPPTVKVISSTQVVTQKKVNDQFHTSHYYCANFYLNPPSPLPYTLAKPSVIYLACSPHLSAVVGAVAPGGQAASY